MSETELFVESDPDFRILHADVRHYANMAEAEFRSALAQDLLGDFPEIADRLGVFIEQGPKRFMRGLFPLFARISELCDQFDSLTEYVNKAQRTNVN